jgi:integrase
MDFPTGVELHNGKIRITFIYRGIRCREVLRGWVVTSGNIKKAGIFARSSQVRSSSASSTTQRVFPNQKHLKNFHQQSG